MKVRVSTIPHSGMKIDAPIPLDPLNSRLSEGSRESDVVFTEAPNADLTLSKSHGGAEVKGIISAPCTRMCSTCGETVPDEVRADIFWVLQSEEDSTLGPIEEMEAAGVMPYSGDHFELEDPLQEALILELTPFWHPDRDCNGKCTLCAKECSSTSWTASEQATDARTPDSTSGRRSLGDLLKNAAEKRDKKRK